MDVTITNAGGRIEIVDLRNDLTNNYDVLKDGLRLFNLGDIVRITFINRRNIEINYNEVELINGATSILPVSGVDFLNELNILLGDFGAGGGATELNDLTDVLITTPLNTQVLNYDSATSKWINSNALGGGDMFKSVYDTDNDGNVDKAETVQIIARNSTGVTLTKGQIVYLSGATGNRPNAVLSQANAEATSSKTIGWVTANIANNSDGFIAVSGSAHDLDTSDFTAGDLLWLSPTVAGGITATMPTQPNHAVFIGYCARSHPTQGRIVFKIQNGFELQELHNVLISSVANNEGLFYESSTSLWKNKTIATVLGFTPEDSANKSSSVTSDSTSTTKYPSVKAVYDWAVGAFTTTAAVASQITTALTGYATQSWVNAQGFLTAITSGQITTALGFTPVTNARTLTINGTAYDLTANRSWNFLQNFELIIAASDETTALTAATNKVIFRMPRQMTLTSVRASLTTAQTSGSILTVDINENGTSILSTKITIDNGEKTSTTAVTLPVLSDTSLADDSEISIDIDQIGSGTATGLKVYLIGTYL